MLQTLGFLRRTIALALMQGAVLLAMTGSLLATLLALIVADNAAVRFTMSAFALRIDGTAVLVGCGAGLMLGVLGAIPPSIRAMRMPVVEGLKAI
jgi:ABC-type lipoprotein release transport system permease subunit